MLIVPLNTIPAQTVNVILDNQNVSLDVYYRGEQTYIDATVNGSPLVYGSLAHDATPLIWRDYAGFSGNLMFLDLQGTEDPNYQEFGTRYILAYLTSDEYGKYQQL